MASEKNAVALTGFFSSLFHNLPRLLLTNVLFALPFAVIFGIFFLINTLTGINSMFIYFLTIIPLFPFYAGVTQVTSHMVRGEENVDVFSNFIGGIKENLLRFLIHGVMMYAAVFISYYSIVLYLGLGLKNGMFYVPLVICILIAIFFLFMFFYVPPMTVTFDIKMKDIYKNSALMTIGELKHNLFAVFGILLFLSCPISVSIIIASIVTAVSSLSWDQITFITMQKMNSGVESFSLLAIPLFILAGNIMNNGGIARRLVNFSKLFVGWIPGSLAQANIVGNMLFGALSGSSVAAASAMGGCIYPIQKDEGYDPAFATAVNIASAPTGLLIPPTSAFIVYSTVAGGVSISTLFMAGYIPGILMGVGSMVVAFIYAKKHKYPTSGKTPMKEAIKVTLDAIPSLLLIIIVIGGIVGGIFTATEGAGICVLYCLILSICYRSITVKSFMKILVSSACTSGIILFLISASSAMSFVMAYSGIPAAISTGIMSISTNKYVILLLMNIILMVVGMFMDITPAILIFTPIFLPIAQSLGMTDIQFGVMLIFNMCLGNITPPVGSVLFVGCGISKISIEEVTKTLLPYFAVLFLLLLAVTYIPALSLGVPKLMGLI